ncbi:MAG: hypothetical protein Q8P07_05640 [bacterium]|nr:hypothetical protein [bacterium]
MWPEENGAERSFLTDISHIPSWAMPLRLAAGRRVASPTRACPRALSKTASTGALAEGGAVLLNVHR